MRFAALLALVALAVAPAEAADGKAPDFGGAWDSTFGTLTLRQAKDKVTGSYGRGGAATVEGTVDGRKLSVTFREGQVTGEATFEMTEPGNALRGTFRIPSTNRQGEWNAWRQDPKAGDGPPQSFGGAWLTRLGIAEFQQKGPKVTGKWAFRGPMDIEGEVQGRRLTFRYSGPFGGRGWVELSKDKKSFAGALNDNGQEGWGGWGGRLSPQYVHRAKPKAGQIVDGLSSNLLTYCVRAPEGWVAGRPAPAVLLLHGSNMSSRAYVATAARAWPDLARDFVLLGIDGETYVEGSPPDEPRFNYTYVDYVGRSTFKGFPGTDRESPALVTEAARELAKELGLSKVLVGGHSQGGFLAYSLFMNFPETFAGAFPVSAGLIFQCEPSAYADEAVRAAQRRLPLAIVHATNDGVVEFGMGRYAFEAFEEAGFPALRLVTSDTAAHMFAMLPVPDAVRWLDVLSSDDPERLAAFGEAQAAAGAWRDVLAAAARARGAGKGALPPRLAALEARAGEAARAGADDLRAAIEKNADAGWVDAFLAWRAKFEFADAGRPVMEAFAKARALHQPRAEEAMKRARIAFNEGRADDGYAAYREVVASCWASSWYRTARRALAERK